MSEKLISYEEFARTFSKRVFKLLCESKKSQRWLADQTGTTEAAISRYLKGERCPKATVIKKIAEALGTSCDYLCGLSDDREIYPPDDLVHVTHCRDCKYYTYKPGPNSKNSYTRMCNRSVRMSTSENDYCSYAEAKR